MADKMLIDASHPEETRVVVVRGNRIEEFDFESQHKKQLRGNIYLAKVTRVEPSLQAAFVDYGGNRHGFLAFSEIHPDYYQIPLADRQALLQAQAEDADHDNDFDSADDEDVTPSKARQTSDDSDGDSDGDEPKPNKSRPRRSRRGKKTTDTAPEISPETDQDASNTDAAETTEIKTSDAAADEQNAQNSSDAQAALSGAAGSDDTIVEAGVEAGADAKSNETAADAENTQTKDAAPGKQTQTADADEASETVLGTASDIAATDTEVSSDANSDASNDEDDTTKPTQMSAEVEAEEISEPVARSKRRSRNADDDEHDDDDDSVESVGSEDAHEELPTRLRPKPRKQYRIQEVIKRRQILLVQVVKEERGNKGAALTTYLSLAGRYSVLMPNTARGGGISRKITNLPDRKRLKEIARELEVPQGMGVILRTAGANRTKVEVKRDFEYLMRLWENVRNLTLQSTAPSLVYEEGSLIKRSIRDLYNKDISEIVVSGEEGYREAKDFMKMLMPSHAKVVQPYRDLHPIFARSGIEAQLDRMLQPQVTLKSGGYIIINQTEALVAIDVNSGRSTREHSIEDTALQTNLEAADEVARQLRLRDLAGLIVVDFIDMEENRNNRAVEKRMKECLKNDRARIQVGRISHFGLLEMSRQRIRASVLESTMQVCPICHGGGLIRSESSVALHVLRGIEEYLLKNTTHDIIVRTTADTALYMLNHKRDTIVELEQRFGVSINFSADEHVGVNHFAIDRGAAVESPVNIEHISFNTTHYAEYDDDDVDVPEDSDETEDTADTQNEDQSEHEGQGKKRRRRRRRGGRKSDGDASSSNGEDQTAPTDEAHSSNSYSDDDDASADDESKSASDGESDEQPRSKRRRRGKRGGRRNREEEANGSTPPSEAAPTQTSEDALAAETELAEEPAQAETQAPAAPMISNEAAATPVEAVSDTTPAADEKPAKKTRRPRRTKAQIAADKAAAEAAAAEAVASAAEVKTPPSAPAETPADLEAEATPQTEAETKAAIKKARTDLDAIASEPVVTSSSRAEEEKKPKKGGWWQRRGFF